MSEPEKKISSVISIVKHGPIKVSGNFTISSPTGKAYELANPKEIYLCACGHSTNKPFCDGSHNRTQTK